MYITITMTIISSLLSIFLGSFAYFLECVQNDFAKSLYSLAILLAVLNLLYIIFVTIFYTKYTEKGTFDRIFERLSQIYDASKRFLKCNQFNK